MVALATLLLLASVPETAVAAGGPDVVVMHSDGDSIGGGVPRLFHAGNGSRIGVVGGASYVRVQASGPDGAFDLVFAAPVGERLAAGTYVDAELSPTPGSGRPGLDISGGGRACSTVEGGFEVREIAVDPTGAIERFWATYEQHCEGLVPALFGEVRVGMPSPATSAFTAPTTVRWPATHAGRPTTVVPVSVVAGAAATRVTSVALTGDGREHFAIRTDECTGRLVALGEGCRVLVGFVPGAAGTRSAVLRAIVAGGAAHDVLLQGHAWGGRTRVAMTSDPGDPIGQGRTWSYAIARDEIALFGGPYRAAFVIGGANSSWHATFAPPQGAVLAPGPYADAIRYPFHGSRPGLSITGPGSTGCNTVTGAYTVDELTADARGRPRSASIRFEQHCEGATPALRGTYEYRAGDRTPPAPWMPAEPAVPARDR